MNEAEIRLLAKKSSLIAEMYAVVANMEAMKIANKNRAVLPYPERCFVDAQAELEDIAVKLLE